MKGVVEDAEVASRPTRKARTSVDPKERHRGLPRWVALLLAFVGAVAIWWGIIAGLWVIVFNHRGP
jgi:hypothetical protein